jgi:hypothetical protein
MPGNPQQALTEDEENRPDDWPPAARTAASGALKEIITPFCGKACFFYSETIVWIGFNRLFRN